MKRKDKERIAFEKVADLFKRDIAELTSRGLFPKRRIGAVEILHREPGGGYLVRNLDTERAVEIGAKGYVICKIMPDQICWLSSTLGNNWTAKLLRKPRREKRKPTRKK